MAITSYGYPETIAAGAAWGEAHSLAGRKRGVMNAGDWRVTANSGGTRQVDVAAGTAFGNGIIDSNSAPITMASLPSVGSGTQYFLIVLNRRWNDDAGGYRSELGYVAGTSAATIPSYTDTTGTLAQMPLALAQITAGQTVPTQVIDLRAAFRNPSVATIWHDLALDANAFNGTEVYNAVSGVLRMYVGTSAFGHAWVDRKEPTAGARPLYSRGRTTTLALTAGDDMWLCAANATGSDGDWSTHIGFEASSDPDVGDVFIIKTSGVYHIDASYAMILAGATGGEGGFVASFDVVAGGPSVGLPQGAGTANPYSSAGVPLSVTRYLTAGTRFKVKVYTNAGGTLQNWNVAITRLSD